MRRSPTLARLVAAALLAPLACGREVPGAVAEDRPLLQRVVASGRVMGRPLDAPGRAQYR